MDYEHHQQPPTSTIQYHGPNPFPAPSHRLRVLRSISIGSTHFGSPLRHGFTGASSGIYTCDFGYCQRVQSPISLVSWAAKNVRKRKFGRAADQLEEAAQNMGYASNRMTRGKRRELAEVQSVLMVLADNARHGTLTEAQVNAIKDDVRSALGRYRWNY